ncbi:MAG: DUF5652 family protein [Candidatus Pacebacteria bacterium]|nr:DUF5652 family protein [Candidatus Paceibacterota bacterium]
MMEELPQNVVTLIIIISIFEGILKAFALWKAAKKGSKPWYIAMFVLNTAGLLPIIYLLFIDKNNVNKG